VLLPPLVAVSWIYQVVMRCRRMCYRKGWLASHKLPCPVISVGNITVGGTGKTPMVIEVARGLQERGVKVAVVTRGYKGTRECQGGVVSNGDRLAMTALESGDEAAMLADTLPGVPIVVGKDRCKAGMRAHRRFGCDAIILDDGFQHLRLARDLDIVLIDGRNEFGNGRVVPAGPLRERLGVLRDAGCIVVTKSESTDVVDRIEETIRREGVSAPLYHSIYRVISILDVVAGERQEPNVLRGMDCCAFTGIADPSYFFQMVERLGALVHETLRFPDHYSYGSTAVEVIRRRGAEIHGYVTTAKDYVKLRDIWPKDLPLYVVEIRHQVKEHEELFKRIYCVVDRARRHPPGVT